MGRLLIFLAGCVTGFVAPLVAVDLSSEDSAIKDLVGKWASNGGEADGTRNDEVNCTETDEQGEVTEENQVSS